MKSLVCTAVCLLLNTYVAGLNLGEDCATPDGENGKCIRLGDCADYTSLITTQPVPSGILSYLKTVKCGTVDKKALFCCPGDGLPMKQGGGAAGESVNQSSTPIPPPSAGNDGIIEDVSQHRNLNLLPQDICGPFADNRIVRGKKAQLFEMPWMVLISYSVETNPYRCAGSLINSRYVLTAANCHKNLPSHTRPVSVRVGEYDLESEIDCDDDPSIDPESRDCASKPQDISIEEAISHPKYVGKGGNLQNDIALLRLSKPADFTSDSVKPICLPVGLPQQTRNFDGVKMIVAGWGITENGNPSKILLKTSVPVMSHQQCQAAFNRIVSISDVLQICAGGDRKGGDSCSGDSGGPLISYGEVQSTLRRMQHGIISFGPRRCGADGTPSVYTRVGPYMKWILDNIRP